MKRSIVLLASVLALCACAPKTDADATNTMTPSIETPTPPAAETEDHFPAGDPAPFMGAWRQAAVVPAPWVKPGDPKPEANPEFASTDIVFTPTSAAGPGIVACEQTSYRVFQVPVEGLFEGNLGDPWSDAKALGIGAAYAQTLEEGCKSSTGDLELQFVMVDPDTLLLGLDNMIYTLKRAPS